MDRTWSLDEDQDDSGFFYSAPLELDGDSDEDWIGDTGGAALPIDHLAWIAGGADDPGGASSSQQDDSGAVASPVVVPAPVPGKANSSPAPERHEPQTDASAHVLDKPSAKRSRQLGEGAGGGLARARSSDSAVQQISLPRIDPSILGLGSPLPTRSTAVLTKELACALLADVRHECCGPRPDFIDVQDDLGKIFVERSSGQPPLAKTRRRRGVDIWQQKQVLKMQQIEQVVYSIGGQGEVWLQIHYGFLQRRRDGLQPLKYHQYRLLYFHHGRTPLRASSMRTMVEPDWMQGTLYHISTEAVLTESGDKSNVQGSRTVASPVQGVLELKLAQADNRWIQLTDAQGVDTGALLNSEHGPSLVGSSGDFAEYYPRKPGEHAFEEGELVAIGENGLTRDTKEASQLAVITRRAIVIGSRPNTQRLSSYDTVALSGRIPVRLRGGFRFGDHVVPSGHSDGTAVAVHRQRAALPKVVGRIEAEDTTPRYWETRRSCCSRFQKHMPCALVPITVINPAQTVSEVTPLRYIEARCSVLVMTFLITGAVLFSWCFTAEHHCEEVTLSHGTLRGVCDGSPGSTCIYDTCDVGYTLAPVLSQASLQAVEIGQTWHRKCEGRARGAYSGIPMHCVSQSCPSETIVVKSQTCKGCSARDAAATFPRTWVGSNSTVIHIDCPTDFTGQLSRTCGAKGWGHVFGSCSRLQCPRLKLPLSGRPSISNDEDRACLDGSYGDGPLTTGADSVAKPSSFCQAIIYHSLVIDEAAEGDQVELPCPRPSYSGTMTANCVPSSNNWNISGYCTQMVCPTGWENVSSLDGEKFRVLLPLQQRMATPTEPPGLNQEQIAFKSSVPTWKTAPCCSHFSNTGSCLDEQGAFGYVVSRCDESGRRQIWNPNRMNSSIPAKHNTARCEPRSMLQTKLDQPSASGEMLYRAFFENVGDVGLSTTAGTWSLPSHGVLTTVSATLRAPLGTVDASATGSNVAQNRWLPIVSAKSDSHTSSLSSGTIFSDVGSKAKDFAGRSVAAFANVTCRQFGFRQAVAVTNCKALHDLALNRLPDQDRQWWSDGANFISGISPLSNISSSKESESSNVSPLFKALCSETGSTSQLTELCPTWLEVSASTDMATADQWSWLRFISKNRGSTVDQPYDLFSTEDTFSGPLPPLSSCSGKETHLADCFQAQVNRLLHTKMSARNRPCVHKLIVGCSGMTHGTDVDAAPRAFGDQNATNSRSRKAAPSVGSPAVLTYGTWVLGDHPATRVSSGAQSSLVAPKIFTGFGVYNCTTGKELADDDPEIGSAVVEADPAQLCWGKVVDTDEM